jgi:hypothetical protein
VAALASAIAKADPPASSTSSPGSRSCTLRGNSLVLCSSPGGALQRRGLQYAVEVGVRRLAPHPRAPTNSIAPAPLP